LIDDKWEIHRKGLFLAGTLRDCTIPLVCADLQYSNVHVALSIVIVYVTGVIKLTITILVEREGKGGYKL